MSVAFNENIGGLPQHPVQPASREQAECKPHRNRTTKPHLVQSQALRSNLALLWVLTLAWAWPAAAQYSLSQYAIAGGGGQASGGGWTLNATIGQPMAGTATGGGMTLTAGFLGLDAMTPPRLMISVAANTVTLSWPSTTLGVILQQTPALAPESWMPVSGTSTDNGAVVSVTLPLNSGSTYYRLVRQF